MDINKISDRAVEIYSTSSYGIKESIAKAKKELGGITNEINRNCKKSG